MADTKRAKALALKRVQEAELSHMVRSEENEATIALSAEKISFEAFLRQNGDLDDRKVRFLVELALTGLNNRACMASGVPFRTLYDWMEADPMFKELVTETRKMSADRLEQVAIDLATGAYTRPLVSQGRIAAYERIYDTKALLTLLKARKPAEFSQRIDVTSNGHSLVKLIDKDAWDSV